MKLVISENAIEEKVDFLLEALQNPDEDATYRTGVALKVAGADVSDESVKNLLVGMISNFGPDTSPVFAGFLIALSLLSDAEQDGDAYNGDGAL